MTEQTQMKKALAVNPAKYYNVYSLWVGNSYGLSWLPYQSYREPGTYPGKVVSESHWWLGSLIHWELFAGNTLNNARWGEGDILTHETGHYLGLMHLYEGDCYGTEADSDQIEDTPRQTKNPMGTCASLAGLDSCKIPCPGCPGNTRGLDDNANYMGIATDACRSHFTPGQVAFMRNTIAQLKPTLLLNLPADCVAAIDPTDASADLVPCVGPAQPAGTKGRARKWCATDAADASKWAWACCAEDGDACRTEADGRVFSRSWVPSSTAPPGAAGTDTEAPTSPRAPTRRPGVSPTRRKRRSG